MPPINLADGVAIWPEVLLALGAAFVAAFVAASLVARGIRWLLQAITNAGEDGTRAQRPPVQSSLFALRVLTFAIAWAVFSLPMLDAVGVPFDLGMSQQAVKVRILTSAFRVAVIVAVAWMVLRVARASAERINREIASRADGLDLIEQTRRAQTLARLVQSALGIMVFTIALLMVLREVGVDIMPMVTGAGIVGVALGFGSQFLVRDLIAGFFLILENQIRVGDVAAINGVGGAVEQVNLRTIVLRDAEGTVHVFQNGAINTLANRSKDFAFYVIDVNIQYDQNVDRVIAVLRSAGEELAADPAYRDLILEPLQVMGVDAFLDAKVTIRIRIKTLPLKQWEVGRELRRRIVLAFERHHIVLQAAPVPYYLIDTRAEPGASPGR
jgi:small conductance mechanosensitive channel